MLSQAYFDRLRGVDRGRAASVGGAPLKTEPTVVTKQDITDYLGILMPLVKGLNADLTENTIYLDPDAEHDAVVDALAKARALDGCDLGLGCPGWRDEEPEPLPTNIPAVQARKLRRAAFQHRVDARLMEDKIAERPGKTTNEQIKAENALWSEWVDFRRRLGGYIDGIDAAVFVKGSDFEQLQQYDLQLQAFRDRYHALTGFEPSTPLPPKVPEGPNPWAYAERIVTLAVVGVGVYYGGRYLLDRAASRAPETLPQHPPQTVSHHELAPQGT